jgi:hypothetical protein
MREGVTRRSAVSALGWSAGLGAIVGGGLLGVSCGGGGGSTNDPGGGNSGGAPAGSFWIQLPDGNLYVVAGGTAEPVIVNRILEIDSSSFFSVSRFGPRYLQVSHEGATSNIRAVINVYEHADHKPYCFVNLTGYVSRAAVSPSGRYVLAIRSPEFAFSTFILGSTSAITDLMIIDISDVNNILDSRNSRTTGQAAIYAWSWLADDRFVYLTWGDGNFGDSMYMGSAAGGAAADRLLGKVDKQGLRIQGLNIHPDESSMLLSMFDNDGRSLGVWDVYSYKLTGERIDRVTAVDQGYSGIYSPDGRHIFFKYGSVNSCSTTGCVTVCKPYYVASNLRSIGLPQAQLLDNNKLGCAWPTQWRS